MAERRRLDRGGRPRDELPPVVVPVFAGDPGDRAAVLRWLREVLRVAVDVAAVFDPGRLAATSAEWRAVLAELAALEARERADTAPDPFAVFLEAGGTSPVP